MPLRDNEYMSDAEISIAKERGRLKALEVLQSNPIKRADMERKWGLAAMQKRWPELYAVTTTSPRQRFSDFLSRTFGAYGRA